MKARVFLPAVLSAALLWSAFFPLDLGPVAFVALVPLLTLVRADGIGPWRRYFAAFVGGLAFYVAAINWVRVAHPTMAMFAWPGLSLYCALYWPLAVFLLRKLDRLGLPFAATVPVVWVALEYCRTHFPTGFPFMADIGAFQLIGFGWYFVGYPMHDFLPLVQAADLGGVYLVSFAVAVVNGAAYEWAVRSPVVRRALRWPPIDAPRAFVREATVSAAALALVAGLVCYGLVRMTHPPFEAGPVVAAIQGNLGQDEKTIRGDQKPGEQQETPLDRMYKPLAARAGRGEPPPDLVIWPETCWADNWFAAKPGVPGEPGVEHFPERIAYMQRKLGLEATDLTRTNALVGLNALEWDGDDWRKFNSAVLVRPDGTYAGRYDKIHLVPFGEYVPLRRQLPWLQQFTPYTHDYSCTPGESWTRFELPVAGKRTFRFGMIICYEDSDPYLARQYNPARGGVGVDFLVNTSNDGWFQGNEEHEQHLAICRFRAVEARRSVVRAVNMGISAVIDPDGRVVALPGDTWAKSKKMEGIVTAVVPVDHRPSVYAAAGDWVPGMCWALIAVGLVSARARRIAG